MSDHSVHVRFVLILVVILMGFSDTDATAEFNIVNGWFVHDGKVIWGYAQHNGWWRRGQRANLTRNAGNEIGPNRTEDLDLLTDNMLCWGYPGFEHNFGLWYDRRRDTHDSDKRTDANALGPFLEMPWQRSSLGTAWDGLPRYDLTKFNPWYFSRLKEFARLSDRKGTLLLHNFYMQHALLEIDPHYVDFPWREVNCIQRTGMPDKIPAASAFYDTTNAALRKLHRLYIRHCLDQLGPFQNVLYLPSEEYTGPAAFVRFWANTVSEWEREDNRQVTLVLSATKDVQDELLADPEMTGRFPVIDLRYWWIDDDGKIVSRPGGKNVPGRYRSKINDVAPERIYAQVRRCRELYPDKAIIHEYEANRQGTWAFLMAGGAMLVQRMEYVGASDPYRYIRPSSSRFINELYDFINENLATALPKMSPLDIVTGDPEQSWCLGEPGRQYLCYAVHGGNITVDFRNAAGRFSARRLDPRTGELALATDSGIVEGGRKIPFKLPDNRDWALWLQLEE